MLLRCFPLSPCFVLLAALIFGTAHIRLASAQDQQDETVAIQEALRAAFASPDSGFFRPATREALAAFYQPRDFRPVWVDTTGPTRNATLALNELNDAASWGLTAADFALPANRTPRTEGANANRWTVAQAAAAEIEISQAVIAYAQQASGSRIAEPDQMLSTYLDRRPRVPDAATVLSDMAASDRPDALLLSYQPQHRQFLKLREAYAAISAKSGGGRSADAVPLDGDLILPGDAHPDVAALRIRLGVPADREAERLYDAKLVAAVKRFQQSAGLTSDGYVGRKTRRALNWGDDAKLETIRANMEQWRWMPDELGDTHLLVNIPAFSVDLIRDGQSVLNERVIVGKTETQTPIFSKALSTIVLRPEWQLPDSIKLEKLLSSQRRGTNIERLGYVIRKGSRIVPSWKINWSKANLSHYEIFQPSGDGNALGDVKFLFPNKHSVYLHDTPSKSLFQSSERLFSHGCVRLRNPLRMAQTLLDADKGVSAMNVEALVRRGPGANVVALDKPVPVHIAYFTAWAGDDGVVRIYRDYYSHEQRIKLALDNKWHAIDKGDDHLAAVDTVQLKMVRIVQRKPRASRPSARIAGYPPTMGVTKSKPSFFFGGGGGSYASSRDRNSVGDMVRSALGHR